MTLFQVLAENSAGKAASRWVSGRTGAASPIAMPSPLIISLSPFTLNITWRTPSDADSRGIIILYQVFYYKKTDLMVNPFAPPYSWTVSILNILSKQLYKRILYDNDCGED